MSAPPYMPLYVADYLSDTTGLTTEQHGAYLLLLMAMWRAGGRLPNEAPKLARFARLTPAKWARLEDDILALFMVTDDGCITNRRLSAEFEKTEKSYAARARNGSLGGQATARKTKGNVEATAEIPAHKTQTSDIREESPSPPTEVRSPKVRKTKRCPETWEPKAQHREIALEFGLTGVECHTELAIFRDHEFKTAHSDWDAAFRNWLRRYGKDKNRGSKPASRGDQRHLGKLDAMARGAQAALDGGGGRWGGL